MFCHVRKYLRVLPTALEEISPQAEECIQEQHTRSLWNGGFLHFFFFSFFTTDFCLRNNVHSFLISR